MLKELIKGISNYITMKKLFKDTYIPKGDIHFQEYPDVEHYQYDRINAALPFVKKYNLAIDVGAHIGLLTKKLAQHFKQVIAFEPDPINYNCLIRNTCRLSNVKPIKKALGKNNSRASMYYIEGNSGGNYMKVDPNGNMILETLDEYKLDTCDLIKLDVQGFEYFVLKGAKETIKRFHPVIIMEEETNLIAYKFLGIRQRAAIEFLYSRGYERKATIKHDIILA